MVVEVPVNGSVMIAFVVVAFIIAFILAFGVGANDVANFFGTVVGTNTLKLWQVFIIASIFELSGSILLGHKVSDTVRKNIANIDNIPAYYPPASNCLRPLITITPVNSKGTTTAAATTTSVTPATKNDMRNCADLINMELSIGALLGSAAWLAIANIFRLPVSTTHSIVGSTIGAGMVALGSGSIEWLAVGKIVASWILSPLISGIISSSIYLALYKFVLKKPNSFELCLKVVPFIYFVTIFVNVFSVVHNGSELMKFNLIPAWGVVLLSFGMATMVLLLTIFFINPYTKRKINQKIQQKDRLNKSSSSGTNNGHKLPHQLNVHVVDSSPPTEPAIAVAEVVDNNNNNGDKIEQNQLNNQSSNQDNQQNCISTSESPIKPTHNTSHHTDEAIEICDDARRGCKDPRTNLLFHLLQVIMACFGAFVHGGNDISNSISPLMNIWLTFKDGNITKKSKPPVWILVYGSTGMIVGLVILGKRVIATIGKNITKISPASGFAIEFGSAFTVLLATKFQLPISTTHCQIGSVLSVGIIRNGRGSVNFRLILNIIISWLITLPVSGLISAATFAVAREIVYKITN